MCLAFHSKQSIGQSAVAASVTINYGQVTEIGSSFSYSLPIPGEKLIIEIDYRRQHHNRNYERVPRSIRFRFANHDVVLEEEGLEKIRLLQRPYVSVSMEEGVREPIIIDFPFGTSYQKDVGAHICAADIEPVDIDKLYDGSCTINWFESLKITVDLGAGSIVESNLDEVVAKLTGKKRSVPTPVAQ